MATSGWFRANIVSSLSNPTTGAGGTIRLNNTNTIKCALYTNSLAAQNFDTNTGYGAAPYNNNELDVVDYTAGGATLNSPGISASSGTITFDAGDAVWSNVTMSAYSCLVYDATTTGGLGIVAVDFGGIVEATGGNFEVRWSSSGILTFS